MSKIELAVFASMLFTRFAPSTNFSRSIAIASASFLPIARRSMSAPPSV